MENNKEMNSGEELEGVIEIDEISQLKENLQVKKCK